MTMADAPRSWLRRAPAGRCAPPTWPEIAEEGLPAMPAAAAVEPAPVVLAFGEDELARACAGAARAARAAERLAVMAEIDARIAASLERIADGLGAADEVLAQQRRQFREAAAGLASLAAEALAPAGGAALASRLADALTADCLARFSPDLALTIEVAPAIADALAARLDTAPLLAGRTGRIAVEAVAAMAAGEVRVVWQDGHADWSLERLKAAATALLDDLATGDPTMLTPAAATRPPAAHAPREMGER